MVHRNINQSKPRKPFTTTIVTLTVIFTCAEFYRKRIKLTQKRTRIKSKVKIKKLELN